MSSQKHKILHIVTNISDGGLEKVVYLIIKNLNIAEFEHTVAVLTKNENEFMVKKFRELGVDVVFYDFDNRFITYRSVIKNFNQILKIVNLIRKKKINVLHSHDFFPAFVARIAYLFSLVTLYKPKRVIITLHNIFFWLTPTHHFLNKVLSLFTYRIICVSNAVRDYSVKHDKIKKTKYQVIYNGVESDSYSPDPACKNKYYSEFGYVGNEFIIGNVGVLSVRKGQKYIIKAFSQFIKKVPNARLMIIGSERSHEKEIANELYELIENLELKNYVKIISPRDDLNKLYNIFSVYTMASISEGQSLSAIEAMLNAKICLFSDIEPFKEMITDGENGFLFKSENYQDLLSKLDFIYENYQNLKSISIMAREDAFNKYKIENMSNSYGFLYKT